MKKVCSENFFPFAEAYPGINKSLRCNSFGKVFLCFAAVLFRRKLQLRFEYFNSRTREGFGLVIETHGRNEVSVCP